MPGSHPAASKISGAGLPCAKAHPRRRRRTNTREFAQDQARNHPRRQDPLTIPSRVEQLPTSTTASIQNAVKRFPGRRAKPPNLDGRQVGRLSYPCRARKVVMVPGGRRAGRAGVCYGKCLLTELRLLFRQFGGSVTGVVGSVAGHGRSGAGGGSTANRSSRSRALAREAVDLVPGLTAQLEVWRCAARLASKARVRWASSTICRSS